MVAECAVSTSIVFIAARFASTAVVDFPAVARQIIDQVGYDQPAFNAKTCSILTSLRELPEKDRTAIDEKDMSDEEIEAMPARNQVTVFGYACDQTSVLMPLPIWLAHKLARRLTMARLTKTLPYLCPDGKTQVGVEYRDFKPHRIHSITIVASQDKTGVPVLKNLHEEIKRAVIDEVFRDERIKPDNKTQIFVNPRGQLIVGGPSVHSGLTGRKNAIDTYGEYSRHSGAALSGKGRSRIDRVGAMPRGMRQRQWSRRGLQRSASSS